MGSSFFGRRLIDLFGIDNQYILQVQKKEIFCLVEFGFSYESLQKMPIAERRHYFKMLVERAENMKNPNAVRDVEDEKIVWNPVRK